MQSSHEDKSRCTDRRGAGFAPGVPAWVPLLPASIVAVGNPDQPVERLLTLQSAIAKGVHLATVIGRLRPKLHLNELPSIRLR